MLKLKCINLKMGCGFAIVTDYTAKEKIQE